MSATSKLFEKSILKKLKGTEKGTNCHVEVTTHQLTKLMDHVTLNFSSCMSTDATFLDIDIAIVTSWQAPWILIQIIKIAVSG
jgi:hypothetical protein